MGANSEEPVEGAQLASHARLSEALESQLRIEEQLLGAERERQAVVERIQEQQTLVGRNTAQDLASGVDNGVKLEDTAAEAEKLNGSFEQLRSSSAGFFDETGSGMKNLFRTVFQTELTSAKNSWDSFCASLLNSFAKATAKMASSWLDDILGGVFSGFGTGSGESGASVQAELLHSGGIVGDAGITRMVPPALFSGAPRLHDGLAADEFPAILQRGETVIPKGQGDHGGQSSLKVDVKIDNRSSTPLRLEQGAVTRDMDKMVIEIVARDINEYGVLGRMLHGLKRS